jgi:NAD(P)-dependent dehydrogenase (short-subunit alcohol dehydrogenase family)
MKFPRVLSARDELPATKKEISFMQQKEFVMITGASSGVGLSSVLMFSEIGYDVLACVQNEDEKQVLEKHAKIPIRILLTELRDQNSILAAAKETERIVGKIGLACLVNCAAMLHCGPMEYFSRDKWVEQYDVNLFGTVALTRAMLPFIRIAGGRIITIGAVGGGVMLPFFGAIASSKIALEAVNDGFRRELSPWGMHVIIIDPGGINTPANDKMRESAREYLEKLNPTGKQRYGAPMDKFTRWADKMHKRSLKPEQVAGVVLKALRAKHPRTRYRIGWDSYGMALLKWILPDRLFDKVILKVAFLPIKFGAWRDK